VTGALAVHAPGGAPEIEPGADLAAIVLSLLEGSLPGGLRDGDIVAVTSKVVAKAEGRVRPGDRADAVAEETVRVVARRGSTTIARTRHGLTLAAAGVDASNVIPGSVVLLPVDSDASARALRRRIHELSGRVVGVLVTDTAGRAWREGQTDIAIGAAGLLVLERFAGHRDSYGNDLVVTAPAVADELAAAAELAQGKLGGRPFAVLRGRGDLVLGSDDDGPGAAELVRPEGADFFGWGSREAVLRALRGDPADAHVYGAPLAADELAEALAGLGIAVEGVAEDEVSVRCADAPAGWTARVAAYASGWRVGESAERQEGADSAFRLRLLPLVP